MLIEISYTLNPPRVNQSLEDELKRSDLGWLHYFDNSWLIATNDQDINQVYTRLKPLFLDTDFFLILEIKQSSGYNGWLPVEAWNWINDKYLRGIARI
jgi:hypothetical protein